MNVIVYTKSNCPNCVTAKMILRSLEIPFTEVDIEVGERMANFLKEYPEARQMPQIFINDQRVGGVAGLQAALRQLKGAYVISRH
jgi:glutaredoxin 3